MVSPQGASDEEFTSDEELDLKAPRFHTVVKSSSQFTAAMSHSTRLPVATHAQQYMEQVTQPLTGKSNVASRYGIKRQRLPDLETGSGVDTPVQRPKRQREGKMRKVQYDSENEIEERDQSLLMLFPKEM